MGHEPPPTWAEQRAGLAAELAGIAGTSRRVRPLIESPDGRVIALRTDHGRQKLVNWASNDYLGMTGEIRVANEARRCLRSWGAGAGAARLLAGGLAVHRRLERRLATFLGTQDVLLTGTGYQANLAALTTLASDPEHVLILDRLCHASTYDGAKLAAGTFLRFRHNDLDDLDTALRRTVGAPRRIVCVESVYSMDGDEAPLAAILERCRTHGALLVVDEAHALGVFGPGGRGRCAELGIVPDLIVGTCSKSLGSQGGFLAGDSDLIELAVNRARPFIFSTAPAPAIVGAALGALDLLADKPHLPGELLTLAATLREGLTAQGWNVPAGRSPIVPVIVGDEAAALDLAARLRVLGHHAPAIRPPTVPPGSCRLRLTVTAAHRPKDVRLLLAAFAGLRPGAEAGAAG